MAGRATLRWPGIAAAILLGWPALAVPGVTAETVVFGQSACFTGPNERLGIDYRSGILAAFGERNAAGGVRGRRLELIALDDGYEPENAAENAEMFVAQNDSSRWSGALERRQRPASRLCFGPRASLSWAT